TIEEFCYLENLCAYTYRKIRKLGWGPDETRVPGMDFVRITPEARAEYHERLKSREAQEQIEKDRERRALFTKRAGDLAAQSPKNISSVHKRKRGAKLKRVG